MSFTEIVFAVTYALLIWGYTRSSIALARVEHELSFMEYIANKIEHDGIEAHRGREYETAKLRYAEAAAIREALHWAKEEAGK